MNDLMQQAQVFVYANGKDHPPTAIDLDRSLLKELLFNQSPAKVYYYRCSRLTTHLIFCYLCLPSFTQFLSFGSVGCGIGFGGHEVYSLCSSVGETLTHGQELWFSKEILHRNHRGQCNTHFSTAEPVWCQSTREGFPAERLRSLTLLLKATSTAQALGGDIIHPLESDPVNRPITIAAADCLNQTRHPSHALTKGTVQSVPTTWTP